MLLERAKPDLFSEDCDAAAPGSSAPPDALAALDEVDDDRYHKALLCSFCVFSAVSYVCSQWLCVRASW